MAKPKNTDLEAIKSNGLPPEDFLAHFRKIKETKRVKDEAGAAYKAAREEFKAVGGDLNALKIVEHLQGLDEIDAELRMRETIRYASWLGLEIGTQTELFDASPEINLTANVQAQHREWQSEQDGYKAGKDGQPIDNNPHPSASPFYVRWRQGWHDGQASIAGEMKPKDTV